MQCNYIKEEKSETTDELEYFVMKDFLIKYVLWNNFCSENHFLLSVNGLLKTFAFKHNCLKLEHLLKINIMVDNQQFAYVLWQ